MKRLGVAVVYGFAEMLPTTIGLLLAVVLTHHLGTFVGYLIGGFMCILAREALDGRKKQMSEFVRPWTVMCYVGAALGMVAAVWRLRSVVSELQLNFGAQLLGILVGCISGLLLYNFFKGMQKAKD